MIRVVYENLLLVLCQTEEFSRPRKERGNFPRFFIEILLPELYSDSFPKSSVELCLILPDSYQDFLNCSVGWSIINIEDIIQKCLAISNLNLTLNQIFNFLILILFGFMLKKNEVNLNVDQNRFLL